MKQYNKGQGLLEMIIAIGVAMVGLIGVLSLAVASLAGAEVSEERVIAANLAREGIEIIRHVRDSNWLAKRSWSQGLESGNKIIVFEPTNNAWSLDSASSINDSKAKLYRKVGIYSHLSDGQPTIFSRLITINSPSVDSIKVVSEVQWVEKGKTRNLIAEDWLYDWK